MQRVREIRDERGLTQKQLALAVGVDVGHISRIENGRVSPSVSVAKRIADALGVPLDDLVIHDAPNGATRQATHGEPPAPQAKGD